MNEDPDEPNEEVFEESDEGEEIFIPEDGAVLDIEGENIESREEVPLRSGNQLVESEITVSYSYIYAGDKLLQEKITTGQVTETHNFFYDNNGVPYAMQIGNDIYYYITNLQGDVVGMINSLGVFVANYSYDPYGKVLSATGILAETNPLRYRGYYYDTETGFYYVSSRYYDPEICRWISADDVSYIGAGGDVLSYNLFTYCLNDPINRIDENGNWSLPNWAKLAIGVAAIAVGVIATAVTGGAAVTVLIASLKIAVASAAISAVSGAGVSAVSHRISTGSWEGSGKAAFAGMIDGFCDGFMWGGIMAGATFTSIATKGIQIQEIGRLQPSNKSGDGYLGVKYRTPKANGNYTTKSFELHSPHQSGPHNIWHWQQNTWSEHSGISWITGSSKRWTIWGRPL